MLFPFFKDHGVLGLNARNLLYIKPYNPRRAVAFADDKMKTKAFLSARGVPTAKVYARIETRRQLKHFDFSTLPDECVLKPNFGFGGEGIVILQGRKNGDFLEQGTRPISREELAEHIEDILDGKYSVNGRFDTAFFEQILKPHECFAPFRPAGLPDIRIIVFNLVPVMAMLRIPTAESGGKANVHMGGIGIGIDIAKGTTTYAAQYHHILDELPHGFPVSGIEIPQFDELLLIASRIQHATNIGYIAVDLTIDRDQGPVLLEVNARAGLMVQVANLAPLGARLKRVEGITVSTPEKGVRIARELFGERVERTSKPAHDKPVIGLLETAEISGDGFTLEELCRIVPDQHESMISTGFLAELQSRGALERVEGGKGYKLKLSLAGERIQTVVNSGEMDETVRLVLGRRDLHKFLIDPAKKAVLPDRPKDSAFAHDLRAVDRILADIDGQLHMLRSLRPLNVDEERRKAELDPGYNPVFLQRELTADLGECERTLRTLQIDASPLGILLRKKVRELLLEIDLLRSRGDPLRFTAASLALYGAPSPALIGFAKKHIQARTLCLLPAGEGAVVDDEGAAQRLRGALESYGLHDWRVSLKESLIADCAVGTKSILVRSGASFREIHLDALIAHEIETHVLTAENGAAQPFLLFQKGFSNYLDTQEGLAIWNQTRVLPKGHEKLFAHAKNVLAVAHAMEHSFRETRRYCHEELGMSPARALAKAIDLKRGFTRTEEPGGFTKSLVYFRGFRAIEQFVKSGGDLKKLYVGKIALEDLSLCERMDGIRDPVILPSFLRRKTARKQTTGKR